MRVWLRVSEHTDRPAIVLDRDGELAALVVFLAPSDPPVPRLLRPLPLLGYLERAARGDRVGQWRSR